MANEITITTTLTGTKTGTTITLTNTKQNTLTGSGKYGHTQAIGTSAEVITIPTDLSVEGVSYLAFKNMDATNYVEFATDAGMVNKFAKLLAGEAMVYRPSSVLAVVYAQANTAAISLQVVAMGT